MGTRLPQRLFEARKLAEGISRHSMDRADGNGAAEGEGRSHQEPRSEGTAGVLSDLLLPLQLVLRRFVQESDERGLRGAESVHRAVPVTQ